jgi:hypothetical protein
MGYLMIKPLLHFDETLHDFADCTAIVTEHGSSLSYAELAAAIHPIEKMLAGDKQLVCIFSGLNTATLICYLAALRAGQAVMLVKADLDRQKTGYLIEQYRPEWFFEPVRKSAPMHGLQTATGYGNQMIPVPCPLTLTLPCSCRHPVAPVQLKWSGWAKKACMPMQRLLSTISPLTAMNEQSPPYHCTTPMACRLLIPT